MHCERKGAACLLADDKAAQIPAGPHACFGCLLCDTAQGVAQCGKTRPASLLSTRDHLLQRPPLLTCDDFPVSVLTFSRNCVSNLTPLVAVLSSHCSSQGQGSPVLGCGLGRTLYNKVYSVQCTLYLQQWHSQPQYGNTINLTLSLLRRAFWSLLCIIIVSCGVHIASTGEPQAARTQCYIVRGVCSVKSAIVMEATLEFWTTVAATLVVPCSIVLFDNRHVGHGASNCSSCIATCLQSVMHSMPHDSNAIPAIETAVIKVLCIELLRGHSLHRQIGQPYPLGSSAGPIITGKDLLASVGYSASYLFLAATSKASYGSRLGLTIGLLLLTGLQGTNMLQRVADRVCDLFARNQHVATCF